MPIFKGTGAESVSPGQESSETRRSWGAEAVGGQGTGGQQAHLILNFLSELGAKLPNVYYRFELESLLDC